jgi:DedD protein
LAQSARDDGFHEIQLNGKQLVFLFMAATVVSVVIFLCGVLVGRGVPTAASVETGVAESATPPALGVPHQAVSTPAGSDPTAAAAPPPADDHDLSYFERLDGQHPPAEDLHPVKKGSEASAKKSAEPAPAPPPAVADKAPARAPAPPPPAPIAKVETPAPKPAAAPAAEVAPARPAASDPTGSGFALQVTALKERNEAEAIAKRLSTKGYSAYVLTPAAGAPSVYRVRVGKFKTRREAETIAAKLQKEEQFSPWITR